MQCFATFIHNEESTVLDSVQRAVVQQEKLLEELNDAWAKLASAVSELSKRNSATMYQESTYQPTAKVHSRCSANLLWVSCYWTHCKKVSVDQAQVPQPLGLLCSRKLESSVVLSQASGEEVSVSSNSLMSRHVPLSERWLCDFPDGRSGQVVRPILPHLWVYDNRRFNHVFTFLLLPNWDLGSGFHLPYGTKYLFLLYSTLQTT